jgi:hypothetical protein
MKVVGEERMLWKACICAWNFTFTFYQMCWGSDIIVRKLYCSSDRTVSDYVFSCILYVMCGLIWTAFVFSEVVGSSLNSVLFWLIVNYKADLVVVFSVDSNVRNPIFRRVCKNAKSGYELRHVCLSACPTIHMEYLGSHWMDLYEIWYLSIFWKSVKKIQVSLKFDENHGYFTLRPIYIFDPISPSSCCCNGMMWFIFLITDECVM